MVKMNRPRQLNAMSHGMEQDMAKAFDWFESQPSLWVAILTGNGRGFCAGQDLKSFSEAQGDEEDAWQQSVNRIKSGGFGSVSTRRFVKPVIAAVDGFAMGGGTELVLNCDIVIATSRSVFGLPEAARGVVAAMGGIARIAQVAGHHRAAEMLLACNPVPAQEAHDRFNFVNAVIQVDKSESIEKGQAVVEAEAIRWAATITANSPDSLIVSKQGLDMFKDLGREGSLGIDEITMRNFVSPASVEWREGDNLREGVMAFFEKRKPQWSDPTDKLVKGRRSKL
jgi:enoyl-CoA hydratase/carnithine racemase